MAGRVVAGRARPADSPLGSGCPRAATAGTTTHYAISRCARSPCDISCSTLSRRALHLDPVRAGALPGRFATAHLSSSPEALDACASGCSFCGLYDFCAVYALCLAGPPVGSVAFHQVQLRLGAGVVAIGGIESGENLFAMDLDVLGRCDAQADLVPADLKHCDDHVLANDNALMDMPS